MAVAPTSCTPFPARFKITEEEFKELLEMYMRYLVELNVMPLSDDDVDFGDHLQVGKEGVDGMLDGKVGVVKVEGGGEVSMTGLEDCKEADERKPLR